MDINRKIAFNVLLDVEKNQAYSNLALNRHLLNNKVDALNQGFIRELVYGVLENLIYLDYMLSKLIARPIKKNKSEINTILRMGIYQIEYMNSVPDYAAVDECVKLIGKLYKGQASFVNGVLRNFIRSKDDIKILSNDRSISEYLSIKYSHSLWIIDYWLMSYPAAFVEELLIENNKSPMLCIRANSLKISKDEFIRILNGKGYEAYCGEEVDEALYLKASNLLEQELFKEGYFSVQDESSMLAVKMLNPLPGDFIIDTCSAPGGKAVYIGELMQNKGKILAFDIHEHKLKLIEKSAQKNGINNIKTQLWNSKLSNPEYFEVADKVIVDAPCSGLGVLRRKPELKYKASYETVKELSEIQIEILNSSSKYVKNNGTLLYCTCTISVLENQNVIEKFIAQNSDFVKSEEIQLFPNINKTDGFYICKMIKKI